MSCSKSPQSYVDRGDRLAASGKYADAELQYRQSVQKDPKFAQGYYRLGLLEYQQHHGAEALRDLQRAAELDPNNDDYGTELASVGIEAYQVMRNRKNLYDQAAQQAEVLLRKNPNSFDGHRLLGDVMVIDRKYDEALSEFQKANALRPNDPNVVLAMAQVLFAQGQSQQAEELIQQFLKVKKDFPAIYDLLERHYVQAQRPGDAERLLRSEITALPKNARPRLQLASLYRSLGRYPEMVEMLTEISSNKANFPDGPVLVGDFYSDFGRWDEALAQYRAGLQAASDKSLYHKRMERVYEAQGKHAAAIGEMDEVLKSSSNDVGARLTRAILLRESQDVKERDRALEEFRALATQYPQNEVVHYNLALLYFSKGDTALARQEVRKSAELRKDYVAPRLLEAEIAQASRNYSEALQAASAVLAIDPNNFYARLLKAGALVGDKSYREAESELNALAKISPNSKDVDMEFASLALARKDYSKAEELYRRHYEQGSTDLRPIEGLLQVSVLQHHPEKAEALLQEEIKHRPDSRPVRLLLASLATQQGNYDVASEQYQWLQSKDPRSPQLYLALGDLYQAKGDNQAALTSYEKANQLAPNDSKILGAIARIESNNGQTQQAIATLNRQLMLDPNNPTAMNNLAFDLAETGGDLDRAMTLAERVARKFPDQPGVIDTLGWVYVKRGLTQSAIQVLRGLVKNHPNEPMYRYHLAVALMQDKQTSDARRELLSALANHPPKDLSNRIQVNLTQVR